jgi:hypothetical protein
MDWCSDLFRIFFLNNLFRVTQPPLIVELVICGESEAASGTAGPHLDADQPHIMIYTLYIFKSIFKYYPFSSSSDSFCVVMTVVPPVAGKLRSDKKQFGVEQIGLRTNRTTT